ncbi:MAG TPA: hypothetical protein EYQ86_09020 [Bacteroidetes bacterium]|nr:hypothetical protein [Bacteroidota bacterium]
MRLQYYSGLREMSMEPRLGLKYNMKDYLRFKFAGGKYTQNLISAVSEHDIINLFSGFLFSPEEQLTGLNGEITDDKIQKAWHAVFGVEIDLSTNLSLQIEPYFKYFAQTINVNRYKMFAQDPNYLIEVGDSYGTDVSLKYDKNQIYIWATYSISKTLRNDGVEIYPTHFDRIHNVNFLFSYAFGKDLNWETSLRWNLGSGFPFTLTKGFYEELNIGQDVNFLNSNGDIGVIYGERNQGRLPYYHRLDVSLRKHFYFSENVDLEFIASITNAYNRPNVFYFDRLSYTRVDQLPIIPAIGLSLSF